MSEQRQWSTYQGWLLLIMLTAVFLRLLSLTTIPPGLTHDEADHGLTAWRILNAGVRDIYFTIGHGREPLYDYLTAAVMRLVGPTALTGRLTAVFAGILLVPATYAWTRRAFNRRIALLVTAGTAVGFWPVMSSRQMLRSTLLPPLLALVAYFFWTGWRKVSGPKAAGYPPVIDFSLAGLLLGLTFYVYIPARVLWVTFPVLLLLPALRERRLLRRVWPGTVLMLLVAGLVGLPLFRYLAANPEVEVRIQELSRPLAALAAGDLEPIWENVRGSLRLFTVQGDPTWRYNVAERPFLSPAVGVLFYAGVLVAIWAVVTYLAAAIRPRRTAGGGWEADHALPAAFSLIWLGTGFSPVLVTGPELSMTQAIGMQPVLYLFPALALDLLARRMPGRAARALPAAALLLFGGTALLTARDYFGTWANAPQVRVQYESTMVSMLEYVGAQETKTAAVATITPGWAHSPAVAQMVLGDTRDLHWFDGRSSLLLPAAASSLLLIPEFAALPPPLQPYLETAVLLETLPMRPTDLDQPVAVYRVDGNATLADWQQRTAPAAVGPHIFGESLAWHGYSLQPRDPAAGDVLEVVTLWQVVQPLPEAQLFTHVWDGTRAPVAQVDRLGVPGETWQPGDWFLQLHTVTLPETAVGEYLLSIGVYDLQSERRFPITAGGLAGAEIVTLTTIRVMP